MCARTAARYFLQWKLDESAEYLALMLSSLFGLLIY